MQRGADLFRNFFGSSSDEYEEVPVTWSLGFEAAMICIILIRPKAFKLRQNEPLSLLVAVVDLGATTF